MPGSSPLSLSSTPDVSPQFSSSSSMEVDDESVPSPPARQAGPSQPRSSTSSIVIPPRATRKDHRNDPLQRELFFMVAKFLESTPCRESARMLRQELEQHSLLPHRPSINQVDDSNQPSRSFHDMEREYPHIDSRHLLTSLKRCLEATSQVDPPPVPGITSLLSSGSFSLARSLNSQKQQSRNWITILNHCGRNPPKPFMNSHKFPPNLVNTLLARQVTGPKPISSLLPTRFYQRFQHYRKILIHLACIYCAIFDQTGNYLITGADDYLVKVFSARDGRLLSTFRGHNNEVCDLSINLENTMLASGSVDKTVRVWSLRNGSPVAILGGHTSAISAAQFCPLVRAKRYLVSTSDDGSVFFWQYAHETNLFETRPIKFVERGVRSGNKIMCMNFSAGGAFLACGSTDHYVRVYHVSAPAGPAKVLEIQQHFSGVDSVYFAHNSLRFVSGSRDGSTHIWSYEKQTWRNFPLNPNETLPGKERITQTASIPVPGSRRSQARVHVVGGTGQSVQDVAKNAPSLSVLQVVWSVDDAYLIASLSDNSIKVWYPRTAKLINVLTGHQGFVYGLETHPQDSRILLSAGRDAALFVWDIITGEKLFSHLNMQPGQGAVTIVECKWSLDGTRFVITDENGFISWFGLGRSDDYDKLPDDVFFTYDYRPLVRDVNDYVLDEQTNLAPHLMPPPLLVNRDGNPHLSSFQRLVPGRERYSPAQLMSLDFDLGVARQEVVDQVSGWQIPLVMPGQAAVPDPAAAPLINVVPRPDVAEIQAPFVNDDEESRQRRQRRRVVQEGVRLPPQQPVQPVEPGVPVAAPVRFKPMWHNRDIVPPLQGGALNHLMQTRSAQAKLEEEHYARESRKHVDPEEIKTIKSVVQQRLFTRSKQRVIQQRRGVVTGLQNLMHLSMNDLENLLEDNDDENDRDFSGNEAMLTASEDDSSTTTEQSDEVDDVAHDSDWQGERAAQRSDRSSASRLRRRQRREQELAEAHHRRQSGRSRRTRGHLDEEADDDDDAPPQISSAPSTSRGRSSRPVRTEVEVRQHRQAKIRRQLNELQQNRRRRIQQQFSEITEVPELFRPSQWLTDSCPRRTPYVPQIGDEVVYFRSGHQHYIDTVRHTRIYPIKPAVKPYKLRGSNTDEIFAKIVNIHYLIKPPRLVSLKLNVIEPEMDGAQTNIFFTIRYHDVANVVDFIILKKLYDTSISHHWREMDNFRSVIDEKWWFGRITSVRNVEPYTYFQCFNVTWTNGDTDLLSSWDLEPLGEEELTDEQRQDGVPVTDEELASMNLINERELPEEERQRILDGIVKIMTCSVAESFLCPVDLNQHPVYAMTVPYIIDLSTIKARIENNFYRRKEAIKFDCRFIESNAELYNESDSEIVRKAKVVTSVIIQYIDDEQCQDIMPLCLEATNAMRNGVPLPQQPQLQATSSGDEGNDDDHESSSRRSRNREHNLRSSTSLRRNSSPAASASTSSTFLGRHLNDQRSSGRRSVDGRANWKANCRLLLDDLFEMSDSEPFRSAVDPLQYPTYSQVIDTPMDLTSVKEQLLGDNYETMADFVKDMRLIFSNSKQFNTNRKSRIHAMTCRLSDVFEERIRKVNRPTSASTSSSSGVGATSLVTSSRSGRSIVASRRVQYSPSPERPSRPSTSSRVSQPSRVVTRSSDSSSRDSFHDGPVQRRLSSTRRTSRVSHKRRQRDDDDYSDYGHRGAASSSTVRHSRSLRKRVRVYKEESEEDFEVEDNRQNNSQRPRRSTTFRTRTRRKYQEEEEDELTEEEEDEVTPQSLTELNEEEETDQEVADPVIENEEDETDLEEDASETEDEDLEVASAENNHEDEEEDPEVVAEDDGDVTDEFEEDTSSNQRRSSRVRTARVQYNESHDEDSNDWVQGSGRKRKQTLRALPSTSRFASLNRSNQVQSSFDQPAVRRSQRQPRRTRRFSSDSEVQDHDSTTNDSLPSTSNNQATSSRYQNGESSNQSSQGSSTDLYSAVKNRSRNAKMKSNIIVQNGDRRRISSRNGRIMPNYNEDDDNGANSDLDDNYEDDSFSRRYSRTNRRSSNGPRMAPRFPLYTR